MSCCYDAHYVLSWLFFVFLQQSVLSQRVLQVQLVRYENPLLLEFRPDELDGPYCCCNNPTPCSPFIEDFTIGNCTLQCQLRFTICAEYPSPGDSICIFNTLAAQGPPLILFSDSSIEDLFDEASPRLLVDLPLDNSSTSDVNLTVTVEEQNVGGFDMIDDITVPIRACDLFSPSTKYYGIYGIASITLAYTILTTSEQYRNCVDPNTVVLISTQTVTSTVTVGFPTSTLTITSHVSVDAIPETESSSPPTPLSIVLIVILCIVLLLMSFMAGMICLVWIKISRMNRKITTSNAATAQRVPMTKKSFEPLRVMDEHDPDTDSFTLEPVTGEERPHHQEKGQHQPKHRQNYQHNGL